MQFRSIWSSVKVSFSAQPAAGQLRLSHNKKGQHPKARPTLGRSKFILGVATTSAPSGQSAFSSNTQSRNRPQVGRIQITCRYIQVIFLTRVSAKPAANHLWSLHNINCDTQSQNRPPVGWNSGRVSLQTTELSYHTATPNLETDPRTVEISNTCRCILLMPRTSFSAQPAA